MPHVPSSARRRRWLKRLSVAGVVLFFVANALAYMHARAMTHFGPPGPAITKPWNMSVGQKLCALVFGVTIPRPMNAFTPAKYDLTFDTHHFRTSDSVDLEAWHIPCDHPRGLVICFHGYMNSKASVLREAIVFRNLGFDTLLVDFRGGGGSQGSETTAGYHEADDVAAAVDYANRIFHPSRLILYGQSMGSAAILRAIAVNRLKPDAVIVECPYDTMLDTVANRFTSMHIPSFPAARMLLFWGSVQQRHWAFSLKPVEYARSVSCPALVMRGGDDPWVTEPEARAIFNHLAGEKSLVTIPHAGHEGAYPRDPEMWTAAVAQFIGRAVSYPPGMDRR